jgi:hypothetical protein
MPSSPACERHTERQCPVCTASAQYQTVAALKAFRKRLRVARRQLARDIAELDAHIEKARARAKKLLR